MRQNGAIRYFENNTTKHPLGSFKLVCARPALDAERQHSIEFIGEGGRTTIFVAESEHDYHQWSVALSRWWQGAGGGSSGASMGAVGGTTLGFSNY